VSESEDVQRHLKRRVFLKINSKALETTRK